jgi:hypothetical protein
MAGRGMRSRKVINNAGPGGGLKLAEITNIRDVVYNPFDSLPRRLEVNGKNMVFTETRQTPH